MLSVRWDFILPGQLLWNLVLHQNKAKSLFKIKCILFPMTKNDILWTKINNSRISTSAKLGLFTNRQILQKKFIVTLTETLVCWVIRSWVIQVYTILKSSQLLSVCSFSAHIQLIFKKYHHFSSNWLCCKFSLIYLDWGVKSDIFGDISVFSIFCWDASYLSWEASQQNFVFIFLHHLANPNFRDNKNFWAETKFNISSRIHC